MTITHGGLFDGGGGLHLAVEQVLDAETVWMCEKDPDASAVLAHNWPGVPNYGDIDRLEPGTTPLVDLITLGFPCQDVSLGGRRAGLRPGTRSGLWAKAFVVIADQARRALAAGLAPPLVIIENVRGLLSAEAHSDVEPCPDCLGDPAAPALRALGAVLGDLADLGFDAEWGMHSAAGAGLAHLRERVFLVAAHSERAELERRRRGGHVDGPPRGGQAGHAAGDRRAVAPDPEGQRRGARGHRHEAGHPPRGRRDDAGRGRQHDGPRPRWGRHARAILRAERTVGRRAPWPLLGGPRGGRNLNPPFVEWLMGWPEGHVTAVPGVGEKAALRIFGNGVAPQSAAHAIPQLLDRLLEP